MLLEQAGGPKAGLIAWIAVLVVAASLAGCAGSSNNGSASLSSNGQMASDGITPRQDTTPAHPRAAQPAETVAYVSPAGGNAYKIGPLDVLDISVFNVPELSKSVQVADTGSINLPLVGEIPAAGKTAQQLERELTSKLGAKYLQNPQVTVLVKEYNSQRVTVSGAVGHPGVFPVQGKTSLLQIVATAGGLQDSSDSTVLVLRETDGKRSAAKFDLSAIQMGNAQDPTIQSGDTIIAGTSAIKKGFNTILKVLPLAGLFALL